MKNLSQVTSKAPVSCSTAEIEEFIRLVKQGGEVADEGLEHRVMNAEQLVFLQSGGQVVGVAALKRPNPTYRERVASASGIGLSEASFRYELGWVFVAPSARGNGYSQSLVQEALSLSDNCGVFATSRTDNGPMHRTLVKLGFKQVGMAYASRHGEHRLQLFTLRTLMD